MDDLYILLEHARRRRWLQHIARSAAIGLAVGCVLGLLAGLAFIAWPDDRAQVWMAALVATGLAWGIMAGVGRKPTLAQIAVAIDRRADLKDRIHTALQLSCREPLDAYGRLQQRDALQWLRRQRVSGLFPWHWPPEGSWAAAALLLAAGAIVLVPRPQPVAARQAALPRALQMETADLVEQIESLEQMARDLQSEEARKLGEQLRRMLTQMQQQSTNPEEAMVHLAKMTAAVQQAAAPFDAALLQQAIREMGEGLSPLAGFEPAAERLKQGEFDKASHSLELFGQKIGAGDVPMLRSAGLLDSRLAQMAEQAQAAGLKDLGETLQQLRESIRNGSRGECQAALSRLSNLVGKYGQRAKVGAAMRLQLASLAQVKANLTCQGGYCDGCRGGSECEGGNCRGIRSGLPQLTAAESKKPGSGAGTAISMNKFGQATELRGNRSRQQVTGQMGEGSSEIEVELAVEGEQAASRQYREVYAKYRKISEAAMIEEAVPLGHRQAIKRYFELIHPDRLETADHATR